MGSDQQSQIVVLGANFAGIQSAIKLTKLIGSESQIKIILINSENYFLFNSLLYEVIGGSVTPGNIVRPIRSLNNKIHFIQGKAKKILRAEKQIEIELLSGNLELIQYDQLIIAMDKVIHLPEIPGLLEHSLPLFNIGDALAIKQHILECLELAEINSDINQRKELLSFAVIADELKGVSIASEIELLVKKALINYPSLSLNDIHIHLFKKPGITQVNSKFEKEIKTIFSDMRVKVFVEPEISTVTATHVINNNGDKIPCRTLIWTCSINPPFLTENFSCDLYGNLKIDKDFKIENESNIFAVGDCTDVASEYFFQPMIEAQMGRMVAYNAWANQEGHPLCWWSANKFVPNVISLGRYASEFQFFGVHFSGWLAWFITRVMSSFLLPGFIRNFIPFKQDIVAFSPQLTHKLSKAHYEIGDEIIRQGEEGHSAYLLLSGEVGVLRTDDKITTQLTTLHAGELFGEIALLKDVKRTATIVCLTPVDVLVLPRDQFLPLLAGFKELQSLITQRATERFPPNTL